MKESLSLFALALLAGFAMLLAPDPASVSALPLQQTNLLLNPSLEEPYVGGKAGSWEGWHQEVNADPKPANCSDYYLVLPKWSGELASTSLIRDGARSQHVGNQFDTWRGGVFQTVNVTAGSQYRFSFWAIGRASNDQFPAPSDTTVNMGVRAGIDPGGGAQVVWGPAGSPHDNGSQTNWQQFSVEATATSGQISVFIEANFGGANQCRGHLDVWFDKAELVETGPPPTNTPPPQPTSPPAPPPPPSTNTPIPPTATTEIPATNTPEPTAVPPTNTPEPTGGTICVNAFSDTGANGLRDADEGYMAGVTFTIAQDNAVVAQGVSTGTDNAVCFENLPPGSYTVAQVVPRNLELTTAASAPIDVVAGSTVSLEFGSRVKVDSGDDSGQEVAANATSTADVTGANASEGEQDDGGSDISLLAVSGLFAILLAIVLLIALIVVLLRQQR